MNDDELSTTAYPPTDDLKQGGVAVGQQLLLVGGIMLLIFGSTITGLIINQVNGNDDTAPAAVPLAEPESETKANDEEDSEIKPFSEVDIVAQAAYVWDINNQRALYKHNESAVLPLASVTKLMTALVAHEILAPEDTVAISTRALQQDGDSGLLGGETFDRQTLSDLVLLSSSNDGAFALAAVAGDTLSGGGEQSFVQAMNVRAGEIGLSNTTFYNPTGLDVSTTQPGAVGSARDMAFLMEHIVAHNPTILESTRDTAKRVYSQDGFSHDAENTNYYIDEIPGLLGSKTGYTDLAGGNLVVAYDAGLNRPIVISVLGSTQTNRFTDVMALIEAANAFVSQ